MLVGHVSRKPLSESLKEKRGAFVADYKVTCVARDIILMLKQGKAGHGLQVKNRQMHLDAPMIVVSGNKRYDWDKKWCSYGVHQVPGSAKPCVHVLTAGYNKNCTLKDFLFAFVLLNGKMEVSISSRCGFAIFLVGLACSQEQS